ncbi:DNA-binding transcriptional ArsR family regulator [Nocardia transvalensis]|uniref:DNA-binding transcriptional ArsR family regulator n=1 Tax=Nocardia transvalensis TaxID=37333 RepID=A0A7W9PJA0_9NOCA|nr:helix-turn-helix domain-containing protein [Nocardia transvalensis]MBB5917201.1 DNA-binding transcriptional ArsR family regulator [Nocardia transvalensis]
MTMLHLSQAALARCRFAISPLAETLGCLITLQRPRTEPWMSAWRTRHQDAYRAWLADDDVAAGLLPLVAATKWFPEMVAQPPRDGTRTRLDDELAAVAAYTDEQVRAEVATAVAASWAPQDTRWLRNDRLAPRMAAVLEQGWRSFVAPDWARRRAVLERDIAHRAGLLAAYGWRHAVDSMRNRPVWVGDGAIRFSTSDIPDRWIDDGLIFVPRTTPGGWWTCEQPPDYALVYPAFAPAAAAGEDGDDPVATLLGAGRARVLRELARPATSTQLAHCLAVSLGTVSAHLAVLREAGVVTGIRSGRNVVYRLAPRGERLLAALRAESAPIGDDQRGQHFPENGTD